MFKNFDEIINDCKDASQSDVTKWVETTLSSVKDFSSYFIPSFKPTGFFRARKHNDLQGTKSDKGLWEFKSEQEFWNLRAEKVTQIGRCNDIKESYLYCSTDLATAIIETKPAKGDYITVCRFLPNAPKNYNGARANFVGAQYLSQIPTLKDIIKESVINQRSREFLEIDNILDGIFHLDIDNKNQHLYKLSIAVTKCLMNDLYDGSISYPFHAMIYSSIERNKKDFNIIYRPEHARLHFQIVEINTFYVTANTESKIELIRMRAGITNRIPKFDYLDFYEIIWKDTPKEVFVVEKVECD
jgi:hypothetical protein